MAKHWTDEFSFITGAVRYRDLAYLALIGDEVAERKIAQTVIMAWDAGTWRGGEDTTRKWDTVGATVARKPREQALFLGETGQVVCLGGGDAHDELIDLKNSSPKNRGPMRGIRTIGDSVYAVGMNRQVYRRDSDGLWSCIDKDARPSGDSDMVVGFEAIDGFNEKEIYAVGWEGEIWRFNGRTWSQKDGPTNIVLTDVCCGGDGIVYACGQVGTLLRGRDDNWEMIPFEDFTENIWSVAWFRDQLYFSTMDGVYVLNGDELQVVGLGDETVETFFRLSTADGVLWSIGAKDVMAFDGKAWTRID